jgi:phenylpropionate dioxygenase-like ring-hydroxylating dioxygenase large terminal subunit
MDFKEKVHAKAYKTHEANGLIWVYMGENQANPPPFPEIEAAMHPEAEIWCLQRDCNWLQALEGDIDTSHVGFLHVGSIEADDLDEDHPMRPTVLDRAPEYEVAQADWGVMYGAHRPNDDGQKSWRVAHYMFPFWTQTPNNRFATRAIARAWVPMDDEHSMLFDITCGVDAGNPAYTSTLKDGTPLFDTIPMRPTPPTGTVAGARRTARPTTGRSTAKAAQWHAVHRHPQHHHAGPGRDRKHGADHRPQFREPGPHRPDDRPRAPPRAAGRPCAGHQGHGASGRRGPLDLLPCARRVFLHNPDDTLQQAYEVALTKAVRWPDKVEAAE